MARAKETETAVSRLHELGFDPAVAPAEAVAKLASLRAAAGDAAVARALGEIVAPEAAAMLVEMAGGASGTPRREIRRALFRLRQRGIEPPPVVEPGKAPAASEPDEPGLGALMSTADDDGARIVWLTKPRAGGGIKRVWGIVSEKEGLLGATADTLSRKECRAERADIERRAGAVLIEADWHLGDFILCEAYRRTPEARRSQVGNFFALRAELVAAAPPTAFRHPIYDELAAEAAGEPAADLMKEPDVAAYKLPQELVKPFADEFLQLQQSTIVLNRMQQEERAAGVVERALEELLKGELAARLRRRLEDTAYYFARRGKRAQAGWAAAAAARLGDGTELRRIAFFQLLMRAQLGALLAEQQHKQEREPRLIMTPAEAMRAQAAARARSSQRGRA